MPVIAVLYHFDAILCTLFTILPIFVRFVLCNQYCLLYCNILKKGLMRENFLHVSDFADARLHSRKINFSRFIAWKYQDWKE